MKPVDVRSELDVPKLEKLLEKGPLTIVLVYADWCGACQRFKGTPEWKRALDTKNRTMNIGSVREDMLPHTSLANAKIEHYPSLLLIGNDKKAAEFKTPEGEVTNALPSGANGNIDKIVETPIPPEVTAAAAENVVLANSGEEAPPTPEENAVPNELFNSATQPPLPNENTNWTQNLNPPATSNNIMPPEPDLAESIATAKSVSEQPIPKPIVGGARRRGGLYHALLQVVAGRKTRRVHRRHAKKKKTAKRSAY